MLELSFDVFFSTCHYIMHSKLWKCLLSVSTEKDTDFTGESEAIIKISVTKLFIPTLY